MEKNIWTPGKLIDGYLSYRLTRSLIFKFFHDNIYRYKLYENGKVTGKTELRFTYSEDYYFSGNNIFILDVDIFNNQFIQDYELILFRRLNEENSFKINDRFTIKQLRCITFRDISDFYKIQETGYYSDVDPSMYLFDTTFSWCIKITHDVFFGQAPFDEVEIMLKILSFDNAPSYIINMCPNQYII